MAEDYLELLVQWCIRIIYTCTFIYIHTTTRSYAFQSSPSKWNTFKSAEITKSRALLYTIVADNFAVPKFRVCLEFAPAEISEILFFANKILEHDTPINVDHTLLMCEKICDRGERMTTYFTVEAMLSCIQRDLRELSWRTTGM